MRAWTVTYAGLADKPSRTVTGEVLVTAEGIETAASRAVRRIREQEGRGGRAARLLSLQLRITRGGTVDRATSDHISSAAVTA